MIDPSDNLFHTADRGWTLVVPVKRAARAKTRLDPDGALAPGARERLARAIALDTIDAACAASTVERVVVVTDDDDLHALVPLRVEIVEETQPAGIDAALARALASVPAATPRAALLGDLPALTPDELDDALVQAAQAARTTHPLSFVADSGGRGSTLVACAPRADWTSHFGLGSAEAHRAQGFTELEVPALSGIRCDVDTRADVEALAGRLGRRTVSAVDALALTP